MLNQLGLAKARVDELITDARRRSNWEIPPNQRQSPRSLTNRVRQALNRHIEINFDELDLGLDPEDDKGERSQARDHSADGVADHTQRPLSARSVELPCRRAEVDGYQC